MQDLTKEEALKQIQKIDRMKADALKLAKGRLNRLIERKVMMLRTAQQPEMKGYEATARIVLEMLNREIAQCRAELEETKRRLGVA